MQYSFIAIELDRNAGYTVMTDVANDFKIEVGAWNLDKWPYDHKRRGAGVANDFERGQILGIRLTEIIRRKKKDGAPITSAVINEPFDPDPICGGAMSILEAFGIPVDFVHPFTWHKSAMPRAKPPRQKSTKAFWIMEMRMRAEMLGVKYDFRVPSTEAANSVGIAIWKAAQMGRLPDDLAAGGKGSSAVFRGIGA